MINYEIPPLEELEEKQNRIKELYRKKELIVEEIDKLEREDPAIRAKHWHDIFLAKISDDKKELDVIFSEIKDCTRSLDYYRLRGNSDYGTVLESENQIAILTSRLSKLLARREELLDSQPLILVNNEH